MGAKGSAGQGQQIHLLSKGLPDTCFLGPMLSPKEQPQVSGETAPGLLALGAQQCLALAAQSPRGELASHLCEMQPLAHLHPRAPHQSVPPAPQLLAVPFDETEPHPGGIVSHTPR